MVPDEAAPPALAHSKGHNKPGPSLCTGAFDAKVVADAPLLKQAIEQLFGQKLQLRFCGVW